MSDRGSENAGFAGEREFHLLRSSLEREEQLLMTGGWLLVYVPRIKACFQQRAHCLSTTKASAEERQSSDWQVDCGLKDLKEGRAEAMDIVTGVVNDDRETENSLSVESMETTRYQE